ncbi:hypothetical protein TanjilG_25067 [Lupinus angustifolius]|uniref:Uncharacterized protein n=1 Tax=Lupinus angustifolius TaxID=3871 RepID=A0A1J7GEN3_LUPAN|nr:hypothetical protein TanjilG_25067 [Lupinus angustifolius]
MLNFEALEERELDCPHRFRYTDLHIATKRVSYLELEALVLYAKISKLLQGDAEVIKRARQEVPCDYA